MARMSKADKYKKIANMIRRHGQIVVIFEEMDEHRSIFADEAEKLKRRRKLNISGKAYVSYLGFSTRRWSRYSQSCFTCGTDVRNLKDLMKEMESHDKGERLMPIEIKIGERRIKL